MDKTIFKTSKESKIVSISFDEAIIIYFYKQCQAEIGKKKMKQKLSNTLRLNFCYLKIIPILHPCYHLKLIRDIVKNVQKTSVSVLMRSFD